VPVTQAIIVQIKRLRLGSELLCRGRLAAPIVITQSLTMIIEAAGIQSSTSAVSSAQTTQSQTATRFTFTASLGNLKPALPSQAPGRNTSVRTPQHKQTNTGKIVLTAAAIATILIRESIAGNKAGGSPCACPYDRTRSGRSCGRRSAYYRRGGAAPLCFPQDITSADIQQFRSKAR